MPAPEAILQRVQRFRDNLEAFRSAQYNEADLRHEFLEPFFEALGWDVNNKLGYAEAYKDVAHEESISLGAAPGAPDYCFRIGGRTKFYLEAKKPARNIRDDPAPAFQLRRYAWSTHLPLSVLSDFEEFALYDCQSRPSPSDKASVGRVIYLTFDEYPQRWDEIAAILSKEQVLKGSFDRYALSTKGRRGTAEVDDAFLKDIEAWRETLAQNLALRNPGLTTRELNTAVQRIIDRIVFLRICEDRGIEEYGRLLALVNGGQVYARLYSLFLAADERYNSGLFHFRPERGRKEPPDELTPTLTIDDRTLADIIKGLYYPCPYVFSKIPPDILGHVYEQFLGKVIRLTPGHRAKVEDKPEVKKAGGVYYTPTYIVEYIVKETVGRLLEGKTPRQVEKLRVLDPACGSGSFLLGAYQHLLDWHRDWYAANDPDAWSKGRRPTLFRAGPSEWRLTTEARKRILTNSVYGVDVDPQAVEVTKLSLLLKVLEGESQETINRNLMMFHDRALPDLGDNIKCGNSLIGTDFYQGQQTSFLDSEERLRINAFDWEKEFPEILQAGGFDAVIGNPPWGATFAAIEERYLRGHFAAGAARSLDSYALFIEAAVLRLKSGGLLGYITPDTFLRKDDRLPVRDYLLHRTEVIHLVETGPVFPKVRDTWCVVCILRKGTPNERSSIVHRKISRFVVSAEERLSRFGAGGWDSETTVSQVLWQRASGMIVGYLATEAQQDVIAKLSRNPSLGELASRFSISRGEEGSKFRLSSADDGDFWMVLPQHVERYAVGQGLRVARSTLTHTKLDTLYSHPKVWLIRIQKMRWKRRLICGFDPRSDSAGMKTLQAIVSSSDSQADLLCLLGFLASSVVDFWCVNYLADDLNGSYLSRIPIPIRALSGAQPGPKGLATLVQRMLDLHCQLCAARTDHERSVLQRQIDATDREIDRLVYELYGLTKEEIAVVEGR